MAYVIQSPAKPDQAPSDDDSSSRLTLVNDATPGSGDDSGQGMALFVLFTVAVLVVTGAVGFLALFTSWWVLGVVFGVHVLVTIIVGTALFGVLGNWKPNVASDDRVQRGVATSPGGPAQPRAKTGHTSPIAA